MNYDAWKIKDYRYWRLYIHQEQYPYLGRCYAAAIRDEAKNILDITEIESTELTQVVIPNWFRAVQKLYKADWPNVAILGNEWRHLHAHLIPRYYQKQTLLGIEFQDPQPNKNYAPYPKKEIPFDVMTRIKEDLYLELK